MIKSDDLTAPAAPTGARSKRHGVSDWIVTSGYRASVSTVHDDVLARGECRTGRTEPEDRAGDLFRRADAANRVLRHIVFFMSVSPSPKARSNISVWIGPGETLLTRTPCLANSSAAVLVRPMTANLLAT